MVEREGPGGQAGQSSRIENYLGFPAGLSGSELTQRATTRRRRLGRRAPDPPGHHRPARRGLGADRRAVGRRQPQRVDVLIASGVSYRQLNAPGFAELTGQGIYYGAALTEARANARTSTSW